MPNLKHETFGGGPKSNLGRIAIRNVFGSFGKTNGFESRSFRRRKHARRRSFIDETFNLDEHRFDFQAGRGPTKKSVRKHREILYALLTVSAVCKKTPDGLDKKSSRDEARQVFQMELLRWVQLQPRRIFNSTNFFDHGEIPMVTQYTHDIRHG